MGYKLGIKYENGSFKLNGGNTSKRFSKPDITGNIDGSVFVGIKLESGIYSYGDIVKFVMEKKAVPEIVASISENIKNPNNYKDLCDDYLDVNLKASAAFKVEAKLFKWVKLSAKYDILSGKVNVLRYKIVPTFTKPFLSIDKMSASISVIPKDNLLFPVSIGLGLWNDNNEVPDIHLCEETYSNIDNWSLKEYNTIFKDLVPITEYTVRPLVKLFGGTVVATPEETFQIPTYPVTLDVYDVGASSAKVYGKIEGLEMIGGDVSYGIGYATEGETGRTLIDATADMGSGVYYTNLIALKPNTTYKCFAYLTIDGETFYGEIKQFKTKDETICPDDNPPHMIDLGLPSGLKWACCNIGAKKPEEKGDLFAWGETSTKSSFGWNNYIYWTDIDGNGIIYDEEIKELGDDISGTIYDAATVNWGDNWRIPTSEEYGELIQKTGSTIYSSEIDGRYIIGNNGNKIMMPCNPDQYEYWTSTMARPGYYSPYIGNRNAYSFRISYDWTLVGSTVRCAGLMIRPVAK